MKTTHLGSHPRVALAGLMLAISVGVSRADIPYYLNTFDNSSAFQNNGSANYSPPPISIEWEYGNTVSHSVAWVTNDAGGNPNSGSVQFSWTWDATQTNGASAAFRFDLFAAAITNASSLSFDIMLDATTAQGLPGNDHGYFQMVTRDENYAYNVIGNFGEGLLTAAGGTTGVWAHVTIPLSGVNTNVRAITFQDYNDAFRQIIGTETIYIDNFTISVPGALVPPTNYISPAGTKGLYVLTTTTTTVDAQQYQRQGIVNTNGQSWVGSGTKPVTYSLTITNFPNSAYSNFEAYMFFVPSPVFGAEPNPDWEEYDCATLSIQNNADGTATASFGYKVNDAAANVTTLGTVTNSSPLGTWSVTFTNNDGVVVTAPGGTTLVTSFSPGDGAAFASPLSVYVGAQPNSTNNTGQQVIYTKFQIVSNGITLFNEGFTSATLNLNTWTVAAEDPTGLLQVPPSAAYLLTWTLPDLGFTLQTSTNLAASGSWYDPGLPQSVFNGKETVLIPSTMVATNKPGFFRLLHP